MSEKPKTEFNHMANMCITKLAEVMKGQADLEAKAAKYDALVTALRDLHAIVWGECPSLLNEDSGGDAALDLRIRDLLEATK